MTVMAKSWCICFFKYLWRFCLHRSARCFFVSALPEETLPPWPSAVRVTSVVPSSPPVWSRWSSLWPQRQTAPSVATPPTAASGRSCSSGPRPRTPHPAAWATATGCGHLEESGRAGRLLPWQQKEGGQSPWTGWRRGRGGDCPGRYSGWGKGSGGRSPWCTGRTVCSV